MMHRESAAHWERVSSVKFTLARRTWRARRTGKKGLKLCQIVSNFMWCPSNCKVGLMTSLFHQIYQWYGVYRDVWMSPKWMMSTIRNHQEKWLMGLQNHDDATKVLLPCPCPLTPHHSHLPSIMFPNKIILNSPLNPPPGRSSKTEWFCSAQCIHQEAWCTQGMRHTMSLTSMQNFHWRGAQACEPKKPPNRPNFCE